MTITAGFLFRRNREARELVIPADLNLLRAATDKLAAAWAAPGLTSLSEHLSAPICLLVFDPRDTHPNEPSLGDWDLRDNERTVIEAELLNMARSIQSQSEKCFFFHVLEDWSSEAPMLYRRGDLTGFSEELRQPYPFAECHFSPTGIFRREQGAFLFEFVRNDATD
ncbi:hypothetical protein ACQKKG_02565 [Brevundimonas sp. NPDC003935]|uniref:hypothetical protein n=1 Tax=unclassified Brevundimonas TaxID=2622653 RepID=UPI002897FEB5|nr:hypothetical protein [Brevundimonas sp.]